MISNLGIIIPGADAGDDGHLVGGVLLARDPLRLLHQQHTETLMLEFSRITSIYLEKEKNN